MLKRFRDYWAALDMGERCGCRPGVAAVLMITEGGKDLEGYCQACFDASPILHTYQTRPILAGK